MVEAARNVGCEHKKKIDRLRRACRGREPDGDEDGDGKQPAKTHRAFLEE
jgi:hypothetical protein